MPGLAHGGRRDQPLGISFSFHCWAQIIRQMLLPLSHLSVCLLLVFSPYRASLYSPDSPETHHIDQPGLQLRDPPAWVLGLREGPLPQAPLSHLVLISVPTVSNGLSSPLGLWAYSRFPPKGDSHFPLCTAGLLCSVSAVSEDGIAKGATASLNSRPWKATFSGM